MFVYKVFSFPPSAVLAYHQSLCLLFFQEFLKVIEERRSSFEYITETLESLITQSSSISSSRVLEKTLDEVKKSWEVVTSLAENQKAQLDTCLELSVTVSDMTKEITVWLTGVGSICKEFEPPAILLEKLEEQTESFMVNYAFWSIFSYMWSILYIRHYAKRLNATLLMEPSPEDPRVHSLIQPVFFIRNTLLETFQQSPSLYRVLFTNSSSVAISELFYPSATPYYPLLPPAIPCYPLLCIGFNGML